MTEDFQQSCKNDLVLLAARHMAKTPYINYCDQVADRSSEERQTTPPRSTSPALFRQTYGFIYVQFNLIRENGGDKAKMNLR